MERTLTHPPLAIAGFYSLLPFPDLDGVKNVKTLYSSSILKVSAARLATCSGESSGR
jgi:hypothetical protein